MLASKLGAKLMHDQLAAGLLVQLVIERCTGVTEVGFESRQAQIPRATKYVIRRRLHTG